MFYLLVKGFCRNINLMQRLKSIKHPCILGIFTDSYQAANDRSAGLCLALRTIQNSSTPDIATNYFFLTVDSTMHYSTGPAELV